MRISSWQYMLVTKPPLILAFALFFLVVAWVILDRTPEVESDPKSSPIEPKAWLNAQALPFPTDVKDQDEWEQWEVETMKFDEINHQPGCFTTRCVPLFGPSDEVSREVG